MFLKTFRLCTVQFSQGCAYSLIYAVTGMSRMRYDNRPAIVWAVSMEEQPH